MSDPLNNDKGSDFVSAPLITVAEAAKYLGFNRKMIYHLIEHGNIVAVKVKGSVRIEKKSLEQYRGKAL